MSSPFTVGQAIQGWEITEVVREGAVPRYAVKGPGGTGVLSFYPLSGDRATLHRGMLARAKTASGVKHKAFLRSPVGEAGGGAIAIVPDVERFGEQALDPDQALGVIQRVAEALGAFHQQGRAHGEVDAWTVARRDGDVVLLSPGLRPGPPELTPLRVAVDPRYASPEVLDARPPSPASDVFSLGLLLYHLVTGQAPVAAGPPVEAFSARGQTPVPEIAKGRALPASVTQLYANMTAPVPQRPQDAMALLKAIAKARKGALGPPTPPTASFKREKKGGLIAAVVIVAGLAGGGAYYVQHSLRVRSPSQSFEFKAPGDK